MKEVKAKFIQRIERTPTVASFRFITPQPLSFLPGQLLQVIFDETSKDNKELNKYLSFSASPLKSYIEVTKRLSLSPFSQRLKDLAPGKEVLLKGPLGSCVFKPEYEKIAFLAGGIGITPVISILEYVVEKKLGTDVILFYSNKTYEEIAFKRELDDWASANKNIRIFYTLTDCTLPMSGCIKGYIDKGLLAAEIKDMAQRLFFVFGPPQMVEEMKNLCTGMGCKKDNLHTESFLGY